MLKKMFKMGLVIGLFLSNQSYTNGLNLTDGTIIGSTVIGGSILAAVGYSKLIHHAESHNKIPPIVAKYLRGYGIVRTVGVVALGWGMFSRASFSPSLSLGHNIIAANLLCQLPGMLESMVGFVAYDAVARRLSLK